MKLIRLFVIASTIFTIGTFTSCSDNNGIDDFPLPELPDPAIKLKSSENIIEPFQDILISIDVDMEVLYANYDSITWKANGTAYAHWSTIFGFPDGERDLMITDYRLGEHKAYAFGYKDGEIISKDSIVYEVVRPTGDFLCLKWNQNKKNEYLHYTTGLTTNQYLPTHEGRIKIGGVSLDLTHDVEKKDMEYATLRFCPWTSETNSRSFVRSVPDINDFDWNTERDNEDTAQYELEYEFHHNYLTELYGEPLLKYEGDDITQTTLMDEYNEMFKYRYSDGYYPAEIWVTPTTAIVLTIANNRVGKNQRGICLVVAEPRY